MGWVPTSKPVELAHLLSPAALKMAALSMLPVPTRLSRVNMISPKCASEQRSLFSYLLAYLVSTYAMTKQVSPAPDAARSAHRRTLPRHRTRNLKAGILRERSLRRDILGVLDQWLKSYKPRTKGEEGVNCDGRAGFASEKWTGRLPHHTS